MYPERQENQGETPEEAHESSALGVEVKSMRFVPIKSSAGSAALVLRRARDFLAGQVTRTGNAIRAHMAEFGMIITAKGSKRVADLAEGLDSLPEAARLPLRVPFDQLAGTRARIDRLTVGGSSRCIARTM